jgi:hypothetical protein
MMTKQTIAVQHIHVESAKSFADVRARAVWLAASLHLAPSQKYRCASARPRFKTRRQRQAAEDCGTPRCRDNHAQQ